MKQVLFVLPVEISYRVMLKSSGKVSPGKVCGDQHLLSEEMNWTRSLRKTCSCFDFRAICYKDKLNGFLLL